MDALLPSGWTDFAVAAAGASAALAGLTIVTISVNVRQILAFPALVPRSAVTIAGFVSSLLASLALLIPQTSTAAGVEVLIVAGGTAVIEARAVRADVTQQPRPRTGYAVAHAALALAWILPLAAAGVLLVAGAATPGLFVLAFAIGAAVVGSIVNTWVLLVEILR